MADVKKTALVIEDEPILGKVCLRMLERNGYTVTLVTNGLAAKEKAAGNSFDLCLSDIKTPVMNGIQFFKYLQENYPGFAARTIFMTGDVMSKDSETFLKESRAPYILKPFTEEQLISAINQYIK